VFSEGQTPDEIPDVSLPASDEPQLLMKVITLAGLAESNKDAQRLIAQGGVLVDDVKVETTRHALEARAGRSYLLKVGKRRFARVTFT
jgi:tyrosyl-tRNA synthetase